MFKHLAVKLIINNIAHCFTGCPQYLLRLAVPLAYLSHLPHIPKI